MANEQMRPASKEQAPDPANVYERTNPNRESATGQTSAPKPPPATSADKLEQSVPHHQNPARQINAEDSESESAVRKNTPQASQSQPDQSQPDHSMHDEPETGWDSAPTDLRNPRQQRHPRTGGKGGTPDVGESSRNG
ncbi:MAG: hypothetical protein JO353_03255 [Phycisphaerae bacterium]|nr:hypothetical protein [Phycisphaerae bacterium]